MSGTGSAPDSGAPEPWVDLDDVADVAVAALLEDGHAGEIYEITGSELLTWDGAVREIARAIGRDIAYQTISPQDFESTLITDGFPAEDAVFVSNLVAAILDGKNAHTSDGLQRALNRQPRSFAQFARKAHAEGAWN